MHHSPATVLILGLAREGESLARYFLARGDRVLLTDSAPAARLESRLRSLSGAELYLGNDHPGLVSRADRFFVSPGVPENNPVIAAAEAADLAVESMTTLFFDLCPAPITGITGTSGKTTTTSLIGHILRTAQRDVVVGGNIGDPMLDLLPRISPNTDVVLELSSFQLDRLRRGPRLAVVTNISPNHLDRHGTMESYIAAKRHIVQHQTREDFAVLNVEDSETRAFADATRASIAWFGRDPRQNSRSSIRGDQIGYHDNHTFVAVMSTNDIPILGAHNLENTLAAIAATAILGVSPDAMAVGIRSFRPPAHRLQLIGERHGVRYVDDSVATSPTRAVVGLQAIEAPVVLIAGGRDKKLAWEDFARAAVRKARALLLIGEAAGQIEGIVREHLAGPDLSLQPENIRRCPSLPEAVAAASNLARPGDVVLLSPGCTSYDMFTDFEERGAVFARAVEDLDAA